MNWLKKIALGMGIAVISLVIFPVVSIVVAIPLYFLWNWLMPDIFGLTTITFWQAWGLSFLTSILFKNSSWTNFNSS